MLLIQLKKKMYMVTTAPGVRADLKKIAGQVGAKELRLVSAEKDKAVLNLAKGCENGCMTALSVIGKQAIVRIHPYAVCRAIAATTHYY